MSGRRSLLVVLSLALAVGAGWARPAPKSAGLATAHVVEMRAFAFEPARLVAAVGDTVVWVNRDAAPHTATDSVGRWGSDELRKGARWSLVLGESGRIRYVCDYHPAMRGTLVVREAAPQGPR